MKCSVAMEIDLRCAAAIISLVLNASIWLGWEEENKRREETSLVGESKVVPAVLRNVAHVGTCLKSTSGCRNPAGALESLVCALQKAMGKTNACW